MSGSTFIRKLCPCGSGINRSRCRPVQLCNPHEIYEADGSLVDPSDPDNTDFGGWPWGFALATADETDVTKAELIAFMRGDHPHHRGRRLLFTASNPETKESYRFDTPWLVAEFHAREYREMAGVVIRVPANRWALEHKWGAEVLEKLP